jgi:hypothetical protein
MQRGWIDGTLLFELGVVSETWDVNPIGLRTVESWHGGYAYLIEGCCKKV